MRIRVKRVLGEGPRLTRANLLLIVGGALLAGVGLLWGVNRYLVMHQGLSLASVFLLVSAVLVFFFGLLADQVSALRLGGLEKEGD